MAQAKTIEDAVNELMKDYKKAAMEAATYATKQVMKEFQDKADSLLKGYYDFYKPTSYKRTYRLKNCIVPFSNIVIKDNAIYCQIHIDYDASQLAGNYLLGRGRPSRFYRGKLPYTKRKDLTEKQSVEVEDDEGNYRTIKEDQVVGEIYMGENLPNKRLKGTRMPISDFIMNNFLEGLHPYTDGGDKLNAPYMPNGATDKKGKRHQGPKIDYYMDKYVDTMEQNFTDHFMISLLGQLRKYY